MLASQRLAQAISQLPLPAPRPPQGTLLLNLVRDNLQAYLDLLDRKGRHLPFFVLRDLNAFLRCGDPTFGHAAFICLDCSYHHQVPFTCKRRGWCPWCLARRMKDRGAFVTHQVVGDTPVRPWILSLPPPIRYVAAYLSPALVSALLTIFLAAVFRYLRRKAKALLRLPSVDLAFPGAVTALHRGSANLTPNLHFHAIVTDGVFVLDPRDGSLSFRQLPPPTDHDVADVASRVCRQTRRLLLRHNAWRDLSPPTQGLPLHGHVSLGPPHQHRDVRLIGAAAKTGCGQQATHDDAYSFDVYAGQTAANPDRLRRLAEYNLSPPLDPDDLTLLPDGQVRLTFKRPRHDGTGHVVLHPLELLDKLVALTPRPRANTIRFHGIYAANARFRDQAVPQPTAPPTPCPAGGQNTPEDRHAWGRMLSALHTVDVLRCPRCSATLLLISLQGDRLHYTRLSGAPPDTPSPTARPPLIA